MKLGSVCTEQNTTVHTNLKTMVWSNKMLEEHIHVHSNFSAPPPRDYFSLQRMEKFITIASYNITWRSFWGFQSESKIIQVSAAVRLIPKPPALVQSRKTNLSESGLENLSIAAWRRLPLTLPSMRSYGYLRKQTYYKRTVYAFDLNNPFSSPINSWKLEWQKVKEEATRRTLSYSYFLYFVGVLVWNPTPQLP